ncbi:hypothetical protein J8F10_24045 [Gemmata sp. G18]|uniref:Tip attachment protein J domain-containing protein n=1 Tax=Gemmata palustris TaxID=2822762 RepID=A0ABS5BY47_9BACT|nr:phage tail protein [Gemmata palustris]MBP3958332.1 hypothetical protein [Gemmata palustris]
MPAVIPVVAAVAGAATTAAIGTGLLASAAGFVVSAAVNQLGSRALTKKAKAPSFSNEASGRSVTVRSSVESHKIVYGRARVSGPLVFAHTARGINFLGDAVDRDNAFLHLVIPLAGHEVDSIGDIYLNDEVVPLDGNGWASSGSYFTEGNAWVRVLKYTGAADQVASTELIHECPSLWTEAHRLRGIAYIYVRLQYSIDVFPNGIPNISAVVDGKKLYDPRTGLTVWSDNAALCIRDYLTADYGFGCEADEIDDSYFIAAANVCDESVTLASGSTQARYTCNGVADTATAPLENLQQLVTSLAGAVTYVQGAFRCHAAAYDTPAGSITTAIMAGPLQMVARAPRKDLFNAVKGTFVDPDQNWQPTDFPAVTNSTYQAQDNGEQIVRDIELPFTNHPVAAQRIAKVVLEKGRQGITVTVPVMHHALKYAVHDVVTLDNAQLGWSAKPFRITKWSLQPPGPVVLTLQEESSASYDWNSGEETTADAAPDTNLPNPLNVSPPGPLTVTESKYVTRNGDGVKAKATLAWVASPDAFLAAYQVRYRLTSAAEWTYLPRVSGTNSTDIEDIVPASYVFAVAAVNTLGVLSEYSTQPQAINGLLDPPTEPQNLTIATIGGLAILSWDPFTGQDNLDVRIGGKVVFRHSPNTADGWTASTTIGTAAAGSATSHALPLKPGIYLAKCVDASGIESTTAASVTTVQATALAYANVTTLTEHPTFPGTKTDCAVDGSTLKLSGSGDFDDIPDLDAVPDLDGFGGVESSGTYDFSGGIDLGSVRRVRLTSHVLAAIDNQRDRLDDRTSLMDDWLDFDGAGAASADAKVYVRATDDDPAGSPTWGAWQKLDSGEFYARGFEFECELTSSDPAYNILISELSVTADEVA